MKVTKLLSFLVLNILAIATCLGAENSNESKYVCTQGSNKRTVKVDFADAKKSPPCKVTYYKVTEEPWKQDILYQADNNSEFCTNKANDLLDRLISWGWKCDGFHTAQASRIPSKIK